MPSIPEGSNCTFGKGANEVRKKISDERGRGTCIYAAVGPRAVVGKHLITQPGAIIGYDCALEDYLRGAYSVMALRS